MLTAIEAEGLDGVLVLVTRQVLGCCKTPCIILAGHSFESTVTLRLQIFWGHQAGHWWPSQGIWQSCTVRQQPCLALGDVDATEHICMQGLLAASSKTRGG